MSDTATMQGLSEAEVEARRKRGEGNDVDQKSSRSYGDIIRHNVFTTFNIVLFGLGVTLVVLGRPNDAITSTGFLLLNVLISTFQEIRAKRKLDKISLLTRPQVNVIREGQEKSVDPTELVKGDLLVIRPGDQMVVDGAVVGDGKIEMDESLLTGESDLIPKETGDTIYSGSFCVTGIAIYEAQKVGDECFANKLTASARKFQASQTPLQKQVDGIVRLLMMLAIYFGFLLFVSAIIYDVPLVKSTQIAVVIMGLIPIDLFVIIVVAYALGAVRIAEQGALTQQSNAIESLSHVNVLCTDKTGTLTANRINYHDVYPVNTDKEALKQTLADFAGSASITNKTSEAIKAGVGSRQQPVADEVTFSSARKWSALAFDNDLLRGVYVLGALEMLQPYLPAGVDLSTQLKAWTTEGLRVLVFAHNPNVTTLHNDHDEPALPPLTPLGLLSFSDELRPKVRETIAGFMNANIEVKVISGDSPDTVAALAKQAGLPGNLKAVSGPTLAQMSDGEFAQTAAETTVFGRITPEQKEKLVDALKQQKKYVAMMGDGVNDVLSLKKADVGVAMQSGSSATRGVADIVLLNDSFSALVPAFREGQKIVNSMGDTLRLFLARVFSLALLIAAFAMVSVGMPTVPTHESLFAMITVGIPTFMLTLWARPAQPKDKNLFRIVIPFAVPAAISVMVFGLLLYCFYYFSILNHLVSIDVTPEQINAFETYTGYTLTPGDEITEAAGLVSRTVLTTFRIFAGIILVLFVAPPLHFFAVIKPLNSDKRPAMLAVGLLLVFVIFLFVPFLRNFFELILLRPVDYLGIVIVVVLWMFTLRFVWKRHIFERFLALKIED